jgi:DNA-binding transcriptional LysR family regulator
MNYNYLRYFSVLAQVEHYTLAAARLGISQPSLSSAIHNLETELGGVKLFEKTGRNIRLTEEGRYYQEKVDAALRELNTASMLLRDSKTGAPVVIRMGVISGMLGGTVARQIREYISLLDAWFTAEGSVTTAAASLYIHKNTLQYRLKRLSEISGLDVRLPSQAPALYLALQFFRELDVSERDL